MTRPDIEVVHVGSACRDIAPEDPRGWRIGGGVMYAALTTARLGLRTAAVVGVDTRGRGCGRTDDARRGRRRHPPRGPVRGPDLPQRRNEERSCADVRPARGSAAPGGPATGLDGCARLVGRAGGRRGPRRLGAGHPRGRACRRRVAGVPARPARRRAGARIARRVRRRSSSAPISSASAATTFREMSRCWTSSDCWARRPTCWSPRAPRAVS